MEDKGLACFGAIALFVVVLVLGPVINGFVLSQLWGWLVVPVFGLPALTLAQAIGLSAVGYLTGTVDTGEKKRDKVELYSMLFYALILRPGMALLIGWILSGMI